MNQKTVAPSSKIKNPASVDAAKTHDSDAYAKVCRYLETGKTDDALTLARTRQDPDMKNAQAVCLMRKGKADEAVRIYRTLVLDNTGLFLKDDLPVIYKTNYAFALLLSGHSAGALNIVKELANVDHPSLQKLRSAINGWKSQLNLFQKMGLALGLEPKRPVQLEFAPGDLT